jgi:outer membrane protein assembly factor BamC
VIRSTSKLSRSTLSPQAAGLRLTCLALIVSTAGCSLFDRAVSGDRVDYKSSVNAAKRPTLEVPPDLTQLAAENRYAVPTPGSSAQSQSTVSASSFRSSAPALEPTARAAAAAAVPAPAASGAVASVSPDAAGNLRVERSSDIRWLSSTLTPEQLWPQLKTFWTDRGFTLSTDEPAVGVMETDWAENRANLPNDIIRNTIGRVLPNVYSTSERDRFRTRVERTATGSEIYVTHRGLAEVYTSQLKDTVVWQPRPADPQLEAEFLSRMLVSLGKPKGDDSNTTNVAAATPLNPTGANVPLAPARARALTGQPGAALQVDERFDRAWRGVGVALDRSGFTIEDRDRGQGVFFVRYVDPATAGKEGPNIIQRMFSFGRRDDKSLPARYRVVVKEEGAASTVSVQDASGAPEKGEAAQRIVSMLVDDMK